MLKSEIAFNSFLDSLPPGICEGEDAIKGLLLKAFIAGGEFGTQFAVDEFKRKWDEAASTQGKEVRHE